LGATSGEASVSRDKKALPPLPKGANPTCWGGISLQSMERDLKRHRQLDCPLYGLCLNDAAALHWESWSCFWCSLREENK